MFKQTLLLNSEFSDLITGDNLTWTEWEKGSPHPRIIRNSDRKKIINIIKCI